ncbi:MAG: hypothetical protein HQL20_09170 [Candidatus Omnitrophica bacterium]|nr:hypothetical protein [Candidatus Omnitrophota bacterium]
MTGRKILGIVLVSILTVVGGQNRVLAREDLPMFIKDYPLISLPHMQLPLFSLPVSYNVKTMTLPRMERAIPVGSSLLGWIRSNISSETGMFLSFQVLPEEKDLVYANMGQADSVEGIIERTIVENGVVIYDGAVGQIALTLSGREEDLRLAEKPLDIYWNGALKNLANIRAGYLNDNFVYDPKDPQAVSSDPGDKGRRGFIFRIINAHGDYLSADPLDGKTQFAGFPTWKDIHWEDWKPVAGENAWVVMAAMRVYHQKYFDVRNNQYLKADGSIELRLAEELARAALMLQAENGGIRMAPLGTFRENESDSSAVPGSWWYNQISTENNLSWYSAFRMLYQVTQKDEYLKAMARMEGYFQQIFDPQGRFFYQGMNYGNGTWKVNATDFAVDVQTWGILALGPQTIDQWFGKGAAYAAWQKVKAESATRDASGQLAGVGYTTETGRISVEWTAGAIMAARQLAGYYGPGNAELGMLLTADANEMRSGMELLRRTLPAGRAAYSYSSKRGWIPFGWNSHDPRVMSLASTGWMLFVDQDFNPFVINGSAAMESKPADSRLAQVVR